MTVVRQLADSCHLSLLQLIIGTDHKTAVAQKVAPAMASGAATLPFTQAVNGMQLLTLLSPVTEAITIINWLSHSTSMKFDSIVQLSWFSCWGGMGIYRSATGWVVRKWTQVVITPQGGGVTVVLFELEEAASQC